MGTGIVNAQQVGWANQTPAAQATARLAYGARAAGPRRRRKRKSTARRVRRTVRKVAKRAKRGRARLVKGSAAAKRYMARIRRMRKR